jgi:hypothetical protein
MVPLDLFAPGESGPQRVREWAKEAIEDRDERDEVSDHAAKIREAFTTFNLPFLSLPVTTKRETALDVFIKMNTSATPLSTYDVVVAQVEAGLGKSLHDLVAAVREACPTISDYYPPDDLALYASALLQGRAPTNANYLARDFGTQLLAHWDKVLVGVARTATFLEEERIFDAARLPTDLVVPVLTALWAIAPEGLDAEGRARTILRRYLWRAFFSARYEKATSSRSLVDFHELKPLVTGTGASTPAILDDAQYPLPQAAELIDASWPKNKDRLARAILALALKRGGLDLADGSTVSRSNLPRREYHHIFPEAHLRRIKVPDETIYRSLNCALVTWRSNRTISDKEPERYLAERCEGAELGAAEVNARLTSHLIPYDEMVRGDYAAFLASRADIVEVAMRRVCAGGSLS